MNEKGEGGQWTNWLTLIYVAQQRSMGSHHSQGGDSKLQYLSTNDPGLTQSSATPQQVPLRPQLLQQWPIVG